MTKSFLCNRTGLMKNKKLLSGSCLLNSFRLVVLQTTYFFQPGNLQAIAVMNSREHFNPH